MFLFNMSIVLLSPLLDILLWFDCILKGLLHVVPKCPW